MRIRNWILMIAAVFAVAAIVCRRIEPGSATVQIGESRRPPPADLRAPRVAAPDGSSVGTRAGSGSRQHKCEAAQFREMDGTTPARGLPLRGPCGDEGAPRRATTANDGKADICVGAGHVQSEDPGRVVVGPNPVAAGEWIVAKVVRVHGRLIAPSVSADVDLGQAEIRAFPWGGAPPGQMDATWADRVLRAAGRDDAVVGRRTPPGPDGNYSLHAIAGRSVVVLARLEQLRGIAKVPIPDALAGGGEVRVDIELTETPEVIGVVTDEAGVPMAGVLLQLATTTIGSSEDTPDPADRHGGGSYTWRTEGDRSVAVTRSLGSTQVNGEFRLGATRAGDSVLIAFHPGYATFRRAMPGLRESVRAEPIELRRVPDDARVLLTIDGSPLRKGFVRLVDAPELGPQSSAPALPLDDNGHFWGGWLDVGRRYVVVVESNQLGRTGRRGFMVWRGESSIEVGALSVNETLDSRPGDPVLR